MSYDNPYRMCVKSCDVELEVAAMVGGWSSVDHMLEDVGVTRDEVSVAYIPSFGSFDDIDDVALDTHRHECNVMVFIVIDTIGSVTPCRAVMMDSCPNIVFVTDDQLS